MKALPAVLAVLIVVLSLINDPINIPFPVEGSSANPDSWQSPLTGKVVDGDFLQWFKSHCDLDLLGQPTSNRATENGAPTQRFERGVLELRDGRVQRLPSVEARLPGYARGVPAEAPNYENYIHIPTEANGLGHAVRNYIVTDNQMLNVSFKAYFDKCGDVEALGQPMEEAQLRNGRWTQRFQAAMLQYFPEYDQDGTDPITKMPYRNWKVQPFKLSELASELASSPAPKAVTPPTTKLNLIFVGADGSYQAQTRAVPYTSGVIRATTQEMLKGPAGGSLRNPIASGTQLRKVRFEQGIAQLNLSAHFLMSENHHGATRSLTLALTQIRGVKGVQITVEGKPLAQYWGEDFAGVFVR